MDPAEFCSSARLVIVAGKGGVGKTTVSAALARMAARAGRSTLLIDIEGKGGLSTYEERVVLPAGWAEGAAPVRARTLTPDAALLEYLADHGMARVSKRLVQTGALDVAATAAPGIKDILVLGKVKQLERARVADLIVLDAPAAGHAVPFLLSARGLLDAVSSGPIRAQAEEVIDLLTDPARCQVLLVTLPEETPVNEAIDTAFSLEDRVGIKLGPVVVNGLYPWLDGLDGPVDAGAATDEMELLRQAATFRIIRQDLQRQQIRRLAEQLPLPQLPLPFVFRAELGRAEIDALAEALRLAVGALGARLP